MYIIGAYAPQVGLDNETKEEFWKFLGEVVSRIPSSKKIFLGGDLNGHVYKDRVGYEMVGPWRPRLWGTK